MIHFDVPKKEEGPKINPDGSVEYVPPTNEERARMSAAMEEAKQINKERGGAGKILSASEKGRGWFGEQESDTEGSAWAAGLENPVMSSVPETQEDPGAVLTRQMEDIAAKQSEVVKQLMMATTEEEKARLREVEKTLQAGYEVKKKEWQRLRDKSSAVESAELS